MTDPQITKPDLVLEVDSVQVFTEEAGSDPEVLAKLAKERMRRDESVSTQKSKTVSDDRRS